MTRPLQLPVAISRLPDIDVVKSWKLAGYKRWISVCGVDLADILDQEVMPDIPGHTFRLPDPFSSASPWQGEEVPSKQVFLATSTPQLRNNLVRAVRQAATALMRGEKVMVFCHLGQSRSPLVASAAIMMAYQLSPLEAWQQVSGKYQVAPISDMGLSALVWLASELRTLPGAQNAIS